MVYVPYLDFGHVRGRIILPDFMTPVAPLHIGVFRSEIVPIVFAVDG